jgi:hypothetical protein
VRSLRDARAASCAVRDQQFLGDATIHGYADDDLPITGAPPQYLTREQAEELPIYAVFGCGTFRTWLPDEMAAFRAVMNQACTPAVKIHSRHTEWEPREGGWIILLEWAALHHSAKEG